VNFLIEIEVHEIKGKCPVYKIGDKIIINHPEIIIKKTDVLCVHALPNILHYSLIIDAGKSPLDLGLSTEKDSKHYYIQCVDPGPPYTEGGTVIFKCKKIK
jgi:uncharacterized repeat protein (TIGR04076 family)